MQKDEELKKLEGLHEWLDNTGADISKVNLKMKGSKKQRGVYARQDINKGEVVMFIPLHKIIDLQLVCKSDIGRQMLQAGLNKKLSAPKNSFLAAYLMQERHKTTECAKKFKPYMAMFPSNFSNFPYFFEKKEMAYLKGSPILE